MTIEERMVTVGPKGREIVRDCLRRLLTEGRTISENEELSVVADAIGRAVSDLAVAGRKP